MSYSDKAKQQKYQREYCARRRAAWLAANGPCKYCGRSAELQVDHIDPQTKVTHNVWSWAESKRLEELSKCQVLCVSCHKKKTGEQRAASIPHGSRKKYKKYGCRCAICRESLNVYRRAWYARRKQALLAQRKSS